MLARTTVTALVTLLAYPIAVIPQESACWLDCLTCLMTTEQECDDLEGIFCEGLTCEDGWCFICEPPILEVTVSPWDQMGHAFMTPGDQATVDDVTVTVHFEGHPVSKGAVEIDIGECNDLCPDAGEAGLTGMTGENGVAVLNPSVGGCEDCVVWIRVEGVPVAQYQRVVSTDWNGAEADGWVGGPDFAFFAAAFKATQDPCADYNGDGAVTGSDFAAFSSSFKGTDANQQTCP